MKVEQESAEHLLIAVTSGPDKVGRMKRFLAVWLATGLWVATVGASLRAAEVEWTPEVYMDHQLYPSLLIATATMRPVEEEDEEGKEPDPYLLGEKFGPLGVSIKVTKPNAKVTVVIKENEVIGATTWTGEIEEADHDYYIAPKVTFKFDKLRAVRQQVPLNVEFEVTVDGKSLGTKSDTVQLHSVNDCPFGVANSEETVDDENIEDGSADLGYMFAAYVNEDHPFIDKLLKEALTVGVVNNFSGYQAQEPSFVIAQVYSIWAALQKHGIKYSSITEVPGGSQLVNSQYVRFLDQSVNNTQANCVDGSVLFASILRKIGLKPYLVAVPGHMYMGFYLDEDENDFVELETTMIGAGDGDEADNEGAPEAVTDLEQKLAKEVTKSHAWRSFAAAVTTGTKSYDEVADKMDAGDPRYQVIDIEAARKDGIMPISYAGK